MSSNKNKTYKRKRNNDSLSPKAVRNVEMNLDNEINISPRNTRSNFIFSVLNEDSSLNVNDKLKSMGINIICVFVVNEDKYIVCNNILGQKFVIKNNRDNLTRIDTNNYYKLKEFNGNILPDYINTNIEDVVYSCGKRGLCINDTNNPQILNFTIDENMKDEIFIHGTIMTYPLINLNDILHKYNSDNYNVFYDYINIKIVDIRNKFLATNKERLKEFTNIIDNINSDYNSLRLSICDYVNNNIKKIEENNERTLNFMSKINNNDFINFHEKNKDLLNRYSNDNEKLELFFSNIRDLLNYSNEFGMVRDKLNNLLNNINNLVN